MNIQLNKNEIKKLVQALFEAKQIIAAQNNDSMLVSVEKALALLIKKTDVPKRNKVR